MKKMKKSLKTKKKSPKTKKTKEVLGSGQVDQQGDEEGQKPGNIPTLIFPKLLNKY
jgi:hypothetical protein